MNTSQDHPGEQIIEPIPFKPAGSHRPAGLLSRGRWLFISLLACLLVCCLYAVIFVFTARQVSIRIRPNPDRLSVSGSLFSIHLGGNYLLRPGSYTVRASKAGYKALELPLPVTGESNQRLTAAMEKLPGRLTITAQDQSEPSRTVAGAAVFLDGAQKGVTPLTGIEAEPGPRELLIRADGYLDFKTSVAVEGMGALQTVNAALVPGRAGITVDSIPPGADVSVDGTARGKTPLQCTLDAGTYQLEVRAPHYKPWASRLEVKEGEQRVLDVITLLPAEGMLKLQTKPPGAGVTLDKTFAGRTPVSIPLPPDAEHTLHISKAGYAAIEQRVRVAGEEVRELSLELQPITGTVYFKVIPDDAALFINDTAHGAVPESLTLNAVPQQIRISKEGYESYRAEITPQPGVPREITVALQKTAVKAAGAAPMIKAGNGYPLILVRPASFTMGSSRQEQGRRSNETIREVTFKRPFYMGLKEVTNGEFRTFLPGHDSGSLQEYSLNRDDQPAVNITWEQAARYCNWLSGMEKLPPAYAEQGGTLLSSSPLTSGYRLPSEAEWEYCARFTPDRGAVRVYPWGDAFPPSSKTVNIADVSARSFLPGFFDNYEDGYPVSAPPGSFAAGALGIFDLAGNVAEWCHDYYSIYSYAPGQRYQDPAGAAAGKHHLVRGSSWKHASISALRSAFRDYSSDKRSDVGFRVCRYGD